MIGTFFLGIDLFIPAATMPQMMLFSFRIMGLAFVPIGVFLLGVRLKTLGILGMVGIPKPGDVQLIHQRRGKSGYNAKILKGRLEDLEHIVTRNKIFKDTGGGFRLAGHDFRTTHEVICHDIPDWAGQWCYQIKKKYGVQNRRELDRLYNQLKNLDTSQDAEEQLRRIPELKDIMNDPKKCQDLLDTRMGDIKQMAELLFDGITHHKEELDEWIITAAPNDLDTWVDQRFTRKMMQMKSYSQAPGSEWVKWVPWLVMMMIGGAVAMQMLGSGGI